MMLRPSRVRVRHKLPLTIALLVGLLLFGSVGRVLAYPSEWCLGLPNVHQEQTNWCWAASAVSILGYYGTNVSQCEFVGWCKGTSPICANDRSYSGAFCGILSLWRLN